MLQLHFVVNHRLSEFRDIFYPGLQKV